MSGKRKPPPVPLFDEVVFAPDRDSIPGSLPVVSWDEGDDPEYIKTIEACATRQVHLNRRGQAHGAWAELDLSASGIDSLRVPPGADVVGERWEASRPVVLRGWMGDFAEADQSAGVELGERLRDPGELTAWLSEVNAQLPGDLTRAGASPARGAGREDGRDLACEFFSQLDGPDLWVKSTRLSDHAEDGSLRLRVSFGEEVLDDASGDTSSHQAVTRLAEVLFPGTRQIDLSQRVHALMIEVLAEEPLFTQHIAYWNAPGGGALMHHDAFGEADCGGQRGVIYTQVAGETAWLALSLSDLADRVEEYCEFLEQGGADWVRKALWPERQDFDRIQARIHNRRQFEAELAAPGCGRFSGLVNHGPDFTSFLADAGHGFLLGPGDAVLMPSHGLERCTMHSVFCVSDTLTYGVSAALRHAGSGPRSSRP